MPLVRWRLFYYFFMCLCVNRFVVLVQWISDRRPVASWIIKWLIFHPILIEIERFQLIICGFFLSSVCNTTKKSAIKCPNAAKTWTFLSGATHLTCLEHRWMNVNSLLAESCYEKRKTKKEMTLQETCSILAFFCLFLCNWTDWTSSSVYLFGLTRSWERA